jgi:hypothetical protein
MSQYVFTSADNKTFLNNTTEVNYFYSFEQGDKKYITTYYKYEKDGDDFYTMEIFPHDDLGIESTDPYPNPTFEVKFPTFDVKKRKVSDYLSIT